MVFSSPATDPGWPFQTLSRFTEFERELRPGTGVEQEVDVPGGAVRRGALVVVDQMNPDDAVGDVIPERRRVLDAGVDEVDGRRRGWLLCRPGEDRRRHGEARKACAVCLHAGVS